MSQQQTMTQNTIVQNYLKLSNDIGGANPIPELLSCLTAGLKTCAISSPTEVLTDGQVIALCAVLPLAHLEELTFHDLMLNINSWVAIADAASKCKPLQKLCLKDCVFKDGQGVPTFARTLGGCHVSVLDVSNCKLGDEFANGLSEAALLKGDKLTYLRMAACGLSDEGACCLAKTLEAEGMLSSLKVLDLSYNRIGDKGACALAAMLVSEGVQSSLPLQSLELEANMITDVGCLALARAAKSALVLSRLCVSMNTATDATLHALADALRFNTGTLKEVAVAGARASEEAAIAVIRAAVRNNSLQLLDLRGVTLGPEGVQHVCQLLRYTATLNTLRVDVSSRDEAEAIARELPNNRSLLHLSVGGPVPEALMTQMTETLAQNNMRNNTGSPARALPHIAAWIENATLGNAVSGHTVVAQAKREQRSRSRSTSPGPNMRSPRSEAGGSVYSHGTYTTNKTHRTATTYLSFQFSQMSRKTGISSSPLRLSTSLAAGGAQEKAAVIFRKHDINQDNYLNRDEMLAALHEVGVFNGIRAKQIGKLLDHEFKKADWDNDGKISLQDFITYYEKIAYYQTQLAREGRIKSASHKHSIPVGVENSPALKRVFKNYCKYALGQGRVYTQEGVPHMNAQQFHRLVQDAGFVEPEGRLSTTAVDVVFHRYRPSGARRLGYKEFVEALAAVAYEAGMQFEDVMVALGCRGANPLTPEGSGRASDAGLIRTALDDSGMDNFSGILAPGGLASIQELPTPQPTPVGASGPSSGLHKPQATSHPLGKDKKKTKKTTSTKAQGISNPLYEGMAQFDAQAAARAAEASRAAVEQRHRQEVEQLQQRLMSLEMRLTQQQSMPGGVADTRLLSNSSDAGVNAAGIAGRLSKLEASLSQSSSKQEDLDGLARQMDGLQAMLGRLTDDITRLKSGPALPGSQAPASAPSPDTSALVKQVEALTGLVGQLAGDVRGMLGRVDGLATQLASVTLEQKSLAMRSAPSNTNNTAGGAAPGSGITADALAAMEKRLADRQARFEGALMQVARQVDLLDCKIKEEHSFKTLDTSQGGTSALSFSAKLTPALAKVHNFDD